MPVRFDGPMSWRPLHVSAFVVVKLSSISCVHSFSPDSQVPYSFYALYFVYRTVQPKSLACFYFYFVFVNRLSTLYRSFGYENTSDIIDHSLFIQSNPSIWYLIRYAMIYLISFFTIVSSFLFFSLLLLHFVLLDSRSRVAYVFVHVCVCVIHWWNLFNFW